MKGQRKMTNNRENLLKLLEAKYDHAHRMAEIEKKTFHRRTESKKYIAIACAYYDMMAMLKDEKYFNEMVNIFMKESK